MRRASGPARKGRVQLQSVPVDLEKILEELRAERSNMEDAILSLKRLAETRRRRGCRSGAVPDEGPPNCGTVPAAGGAIETAVPREGRDKGSKAS